MTAEIGALDAWLANPPAPRPAAAVSWWPGGAPPSTEQTAVEPGAGAAALSAPAAGELAEIRAELELTRARAQLQRDPAWLDELSPSERAQERHAAEQIRAMRREQALRAATSTEKLGGREQRVEARLAAMELSDRMWSRRAQARRMRLLDPTSRLASLQRTHAASSAALIAVAVAGIAWTAMGVHDALVGPGGNPLAYVVEPIFSVPLLVIMGLSARVAQFGATFPPPAQRGRVYAVEAFLLIATIAMNTVSVLPGVGSWHNAATLLAHLVPPVLIVIAVALQPLVAGFLAEILTGAALNSEGEDPGERDRLDAQARDTLELSARVHAAMTRGELSAWSDTGLPSISAIQRHLQCEKRRAQRVWDALHILSTTAVDQPSTPTIAARRTS